MEAGKLFAIEQKGLEKFSLLRQWLNAKASPGILEQQVRGRGLFVLGFHSMASPGLLVPKVLILCDIWPLPRLEKADFRLCPPKREGMVRERKLAKQIGEKSCGCEKPGLRGICSSERSSEGGHLETRFQKILEFQQAHKYGHLYSIL